jgi:HlyD family secretion protein
MTIRIVVILVTALGMLACQPPADQHQMVGQLESDRIELSAEFSEPIISRSVNEGQVVSTGDIVIRQNPDRANARVREAEAALMQIQARLDELIRGPRKEQIVAAQANVDGAKQELAFRQTELERVRALLGRKLSSPGDHDRALVALDSAEASLDFNKARLAELLSGTTVEELDQARAAVMVAAAQRDRSQIDLDRLTTVAPVDGVIDSFLFETGERPISGQPMAIMLAGQQPYARIYVPADLRARVAPGTEARVLAEGIEQPLKGRFRWIASEAAFTPYFALTEHDRGRLTYLAKIDIEVTGARLPDGVPVEVELVVTGSIPE